MGARLTPRTIATGIVGLAMTAVALGALGVQASRGDSVIGVQLLAKTKHDAALDNAFYNCLDVQAHSLVSPGEPVFLVVTNVSDWVTMMKAVGSWVTLASSAASAKVDLALKDRVTDRPACLGTEVIAQPVGSRDPTAIRQGTGASVPGTGPPPATPL